MAATSWVESQITDATRDFRIIFKDGQPRQVIDDALTGEAIGVITEWREVFGPRDYGIGAGHRAEVEMKLALNWIVRSPVQTDPSIRADSV